MTARPQFLTAGAFSMVANLLMLTPTLYMLQLYERVLVSENLMSLLAVSLMALASLLAMAWADRRRNRSLILASLRLDQALAPRIADATQCAAWAGWDPSRDGHPPMTDLIRVRHFVCGQGALALLDLPWTPVYLGVLWLLHPWLGLGVLVFFVLQTMQAWYGHQRSQALSQRTQEVDQAAQVFLRSKLRQAEAVQAMGMTGGLWLRWWDKHAQHLQTSGAAASGQSRLQAASRFLRYVQQSLGLALGAWLVVRGELGIGAMIAASVLTTRALAPVDALVGAWTGLHFALAAARRVNRLIATYPPLAPAAQRPTFRGQISLRSSQVCPPGNSRPVLHDICLQLEPGTLTVLVGPSGAGKSSLVRVLAGAWPLPQGELRHDGRQLSERQRLGLGPLIGYVPQDIELANACVRDHIARLGPPDPQAVVDAARRCGVHDAILRLPAGYDTLVGLAGHPLSGGLRQRIALARAVYGRPPLLLLDEPNAHLDDVGEADLATLLCEHRAQGGTALVVSHRPGVLTLADRVLFLKNGRIVQDGPAARLSTPALPAQPGSAISPVPRPI